MSPPRVSELGHVGIRCFDTKVQLAFYTEVMGLTVTDFDEGLGIWFLSARPDDEHHELLLAAGRNVGRESNLLQQISFRCESLEDVVGYFERFRANGVTLDMVVSHGNAIGVYFYDPEGNRCEVYWQTGLEARQPFVEHIDLDTDLDELLARVRASVERFGETGFTESTYRDWTLEQSSQTTESGATR
jgi:catechol 2,3-dioxygenase-like lactoylglutathione lyase family enzyme